MTGLIASPGIELIHLRYCWELRSTWPNPVLIICFGKSTAVVNPGPYRSTMKGEKMKRFGTDWLLSHNISKVGSTVHIYLTDSKNLYISICSNIFIVVCYDLRVVCYHTKNIREKSCTRWYREVTEYSIQGYSPYQNWHCWADRGSLGNVVSCRIQIGKFSTTSRLLATLYDK